jgi:hypothetical protein
MHAALAETNLAGLLYLQSVSRSPFHSFDLAFSSLTPITTTTIDMVHSEHQAFYSESLVRFLLFSLVVLSFHSLYHSSPPSSFRIEIGALSGRGQVEVWRNITVSAQKRHGLQR